MSYKTAYARLFWVFLFVFGSLLALNALGEHQEIEAASLQSNGGAPALEGVTLTVGPDLALSDTLPGAPIDRQVYFNNAQAGVLTLTFEISGTAPLTLTPGAAFGYTPTRRLTTTGPSWRPVVTYPVPTTATTETGVRYTITNAGQLSTTLWLTYVRDISSPSTVTLNVPAVLTTVHGPDYALTGTAEDGGAGVARVEVLTESGDAWKTAAGAESWTYIWTLPDADHVVYTPTARATDYVGNQGNVSQTVVVDTVAPTVTAPVDAGAWSPTTTLVFTWDGAQDNAGIRGYLVNVTGTMGFTQTAFTADEVYTITANAEGEIYYARLKAEDANGNRSPAFGPSSDGITLDDVRPYTGSVTINDGDPYTNDPEVTLDLYADDAGSGVTEMCITEKANCESWEAYQTRREYSLSAPPEGLKTVHVWYRDRPDNAAGPYTDTIFLDTQSPSVTITAPAQAATTPVTVSWEADDPAPSSDNLTYRVRYQEDDGPWVTWHESTTRTMDGFNLAELDHTYTFSVTARDAAGNAGHGQATLRYERFEVFIPLASRNWVAWHQDDLNEPNDTRDQSGANILLEPNKTYEAYVWHADDNDYYAYVSDEGGNVRVHLDLSAEGLNPDVDYDLYIYDGETGEMVAWSNYTKVPTEEVEFSAEAGRKYYIRVYPFQGYNNEVPYKLTIHDPS